MAIKKPAVITYHMMVDIKGQIHVPIEAATLEAALEKARSMNTLQMIEGLEDWNDYEHEITGLWK